MTRRERLYSYGKHGGGPKLSLGKKLAIVALIFGMTVAVYLICFVGRSPVGPQITPIVRVISSFDFDYVSDIATREAKERAANRVPPAYDIVKISDENLNTNLLKLVSLLNERQTGASGETAQTPDDPKEMTDEAFLEHVKRTTGFNINAADLPYILSETNTANRQRIFWLVLAPLREIINDGIYRDDDEIFSRGDDAMLEFSGQTHHRRSQSMARRELKARINSLGISDSLSDAFYRIFNAKITPNMNYNEAETKKKIDRFVSKIKPTVVSVKEGDVISDPSKADRLSQERWSAYQREIKKNQIERSTFKEFVLEFMTSFLLIFSAALFIAVSRSSQTRKPRTVFLFSTLLLFNLLIERIVIQISDANPTNSWLHVMVYGAPIIIGPILQVLLCSPYTGFVMTLILTILTVMMLGQNVAFMVVVLTSVLVAIYFVNGAQTRRQVLMGGTLYGVVLSLSSSILYIVYEYETSYILKLSGIAIMVGFVMGVAATLLLPIVERIFKMSSNITLLEFTDYNNPLLRMLQMEAPGTYHHSLMVSQIAEQAAVRIGANHLVCSVGGLYHDVGKVIKPEFFSENQAAGNPHDSQSPTMSALIIKSHIREGLDLAKKYKMPPPVIEAISQHHGTGIISYFYNKAVSMAGGNASKSDLFEALRDAGVEESTFRHEGRKPQTTETAILMLADSCEAASRSLKRVTAHSIEELVANIFQSKMSDGQLDEAPITLKQIARVKESFIFTLKNMLHSRVEYNNSPGQGGGDNPKSNELESQKPKD